MSKAIREFARGKECQIRIYGVCNRNNETVVLCHLNGGGLSLKRSDIHAAFGCSACHDEVDRRSMKIDKDTAQIAFYEGVIRTQELLQKEGLM
jgi:hypothetical protein